MSVSQTIKTRLGIKAFTLSAVDADEHVLAFTYTDKKCEVHLLMRECAPLYLEENASVALINTEQLGIFLLAATPSQKQAKDATVAFRIWDSATVLGFTPKEIQVEDVDGTCNQDGKFRSQIHLNENISDMSAVKLDCHGTMVALMSEAEILLWDVHKTDTGAFRLQYINTISLKGKQINKNFALLQSNGTMTIAVGDSGSLSVWTVNKTGIPVCKSIQLPSKPNGSPSVVERLHRLTSTILIFDDDLGKLWIFSLQTNSVIPVKLPGNSGCCGIYSFSPSKGKNRGTLAVCNEAHSINLYSLEVNSNNSASKPVWSCGRPFKVLFSIAPINSLVFVKPDTLAVASSTNQTLTFWSGFVPGTI